MKRKELEELIADFNATCGQEESLTAQSRNGYIGVDVYKDGRCRYTLACGTVSDCYVAVSDMFVGRLKDMLRDARAGQ